MKKTYVKRIPTLRGLSGSLSVSGYCSTGVMGKGLTLTDDALLGVFGELAGATKYR